jgi:hypothetical protein
VVIDTKALNERLKQTYNEGREDERLGKKGWK